MVSPPLTERTWPVMYLASSEAKNTTAAATSWGEARRLSGMARTRASFRRSFCAAKSGVSVGPGQTQFTVIEWRAISLASDFDRAMTPPFAPA